MQLIIIQGLMRCSPSQPGRVFSHWQLSWQQSCSSSKLSSTCSSSPRTTVLASSWQHTQTFPMATSSYLRRFLTCRADTGSIQIITSRRMISVRCWSCSSGHTSCSTLQMVNMYLGFMGLLVHSSTISASLFTTSPCEKAPYTALPSSLASAGGSDSWILLAMNRAVTAVMWMVFTCTHPTTKMRKSSSSTAHQQDSHRSSKARHTSSSQSRMRALLIFNCGALNTCRCFFSRRDSQPLNSLTPSPLSATSWQTTGTLSSLSQAIFWQAGKGSWYLGFFFSVRWAALRAVGLALGALETVLLMKQFMPGQTPVLINEVSYFPSFATLALHIINYNQ